MLIVLVFLLVELLWHLESAKIVYKKGEDLQTLQFALNFCLWIQE